MRKTEFNEIAVRTLSRAFNYFQNHAFYQVRVSNGNKRSNVQKRYDSYDFIPNSVHLVLEKLIYARHYLRTEKNRIIRPTFLDAGCGVGNILMLASSADFDAYGLEFDKKTVEYARKVNPLWRRIKVRNILFYKEYSKFDVIYYYCPLVGEKEKKFERCVCNQMKVGGILLPFGGQRGIDDRFKRIYFENKRVIIFEKVKE